MPSHVYRCCVPIAYRYPAQQTTSTCEYGCRPLSNWWLSSVGRYQRCSVRLQPGPAPATALTASADWSVHKRPVAGQAARRCPRGHRCCRTPRPQRAERPAGPGLDLAAAIFDGAMVSLSCPKHSCTAGLARSSQSAPNPSASAAARPQTLKARSHVPAAPAIALLDGRNDRLVALPSERDEKGPGAAAWRGQPRVAVDDHRTAVTSGQPPRQQARDASPSCWSRAPATRRHTRGASSTPLPRRCRHSATSRVAAGDSGHPVP
jgi:hypothetical protein